MRSLAPAETLTQPPAQAPLRTSHSQFLRYIPQRDQQGLECAKFVETCNLSLGVYVAGCANRGNSWISEGMRERHWQMHERELV